MESSRWNDVLKPQFPATVDSVSRFLRRQYVGTFQDLCYNSNEKEEAANALSYIPFGNSQIVAGWINTSMAAQNRAISKGQIKPHHVMIDVLSSAKSLVQSGRLLKKR